MVSAPTNNPSPDRLNLLLTCGGWDDQPWAEQVPCLLEPFGVRALRAGSGREAEAIIRASPVHIALVDLSLPFEEATDGPSGTEESGRRILELLIRLPTRPPTVVLRRRRTAREADRLLNSALSAGAFAVIDRPAQVETILETMRRILRRHYADRWPGGSPSTS